MLRLRIPIFKEIQYILLNEPINSNTQERIEKLIYSQLVDSSSDKVAPEILNIKFDKLSSRFNELVINKTQDIKLYLDRLRISTSDISDDLGSLNQEAQIIDYHRKSIYNKLSKNDFINWMLYTFLLIITYNDVDLE